MTPVFMLILAAILALRDASAGLPVVAGVSAWTAGAWSLGSLLVLSAATMAGVGALGRVVDRTGSWRAARAAEDLTVLSRWCVCVLHGVNVLVVGWLDAVRSLTGGDVVFLDEALATLPPIGAAMAGWWAYAGIDRKLSEAKLFGALEVGDDIPELTSRWGYVWDQLRYGVLVAAVPLGALSAWSEVVELLVVRWASEGSWRVWAGLGLRLAGIAAVMVLMPVVIVHLWRTEVLGDGPLRSRLVSMCAAQGVRFRELLVWRTRSRVLNGAVIGMVPRLRYVLLTEALLERLEPVEVEAVMAHEICHARRHHLPLSMVTLATALSASWIGTVWLLERVAPSTRVGEAWEGVGTLVGFAGSLLIGVMVFGWVSRRFEEQADAFAAQHLSGVTRGSGRGAVIRAEATWAMSRALAMAARLNHIPEERFSWRHGSIGSRRRRVEALAGVRAENLPIDRLVAWIARVALLVLLVLVAWGLYDALVFSNS